MKYITIYSINGDIKRKEFASKAAQDAHTGFLWDFELMDKIDWIDYLEEDNT